MPSNTSVQLQETETRLSIWGSFQAVKFSHLFY